MLSQILVSIVTLLGIECNLGSLNKCSQVRECSVEECIFVASATCPVFIDVI